MRKDIEFLNKSPEEKVKSFMYGRGQGALIVESQTIDAVCDHIESQERRIKELENGLIKADDVYGVWYNESEDILVAKERDIAELVKVLILIDTHNLLHNNADQLQIEIKEQIAKHIMEIGL